MRKSSTVTEKGLRRKHPCIIVLYTLCSLLLVSWFLIGWRVRTITVTGCQRLSPETMAQKADGVLGRHIYGFDGKALASSLRESSPFIEKVTLRRRLPNRLEIAVTEYVLVGYTEKDGEFLILSPSLLLLGEAPSAEEAARIVPRRIILPERENDEEPYYSDQTADRIRAALEAVLSSSAAGELSLVDLSDLFAIRAESAKGTSISLGSDRDLRKKLEAAARVLSFLESEERSPLGTVYVTEEGAASFVPAS